ncbi:MAG: hypothetical protein B7Y41_04330 [Hydrogenophilales bacterium 28-61-23]|nr:MAG: hypothetical protein B7Y41_04330 [Hydrogenophilales bacterium 28-61-23]
MADPVKTLRSLETLANEYSVFERDQVLNEAQLNSVARYFDDQGRLTRVELLGVGVIGGLRVAAGAGKVRVGKGLGLTTDGDLLLLPADTVYDHIKPYDEKAPFYAPFYSGSGDGKSMLKLWELVKEGESDVSKLPMNSLPGALADYAVVMYMESHEQDHDLCGAANCDNLGIVATHTPRMLLVLQSDANALDTTMPTFTDKAGLLPVLVAERPALTGKLGTTAAVADLYRKACGNIQRGLVDALGELHKQLPALTQDLFGGDPSPDWIKLLNDIRDGFASSNKGIQYFYDFLKDAVETWNALRDTLLDNDSIMCPDLAAFPKHLLLGAVNNPLSSRTGFSPSPLAGGARAHLEHAYFLAWKLHVLINAFELPATSPAPALIVTPSRGERDSLEERAIPYYYRANSPFPLLNAWNWRRSKRGTGNAIAGYRAQALGASIAAQSPLAGQIGGYDFFRIEGHLDQNVDVAMDKLESEIASRNLPFAVRAVLLHDKTGPIKRKPKIRYGDLHRLHKLVRTEIDSELARASAFSAEYKQRIKSAASNGQIPNDSAKMSKVDQHDAAITNAAAESHKAFAAKSYSAFKAEKQWSVQHEVAIKTAGSFKQDFGDVSRTDYVTAFDTAIVSNHKNWLDWIDALIEDEDKKADERLLFSAYLKAHPGLEHFGGVSRGGTFVLVYDDHANVVADFMLPYRETEVVEDEPEEPTLTYVVPPYIKEGFVLVKPLDLQFADLKGGIRAEWVKEIQIQTNYSKFFQESLGTLGDVLGKFNQNVKSPGVNVLPETNDAYLNSLLEDIKGKTEQIDKMREQLAKGDLPDDVAGKVKDQLRRYEQVLGNGVKETTRYMVDAKTNVAAGQPAADALKIIGKGLVTVKDKETLKGIEAEFGDLDAHAPEAQKSIVAGVMNAGGMRFN